MSRARSLVAKAAVALAGLLLSAWVLGVAARVHLQRACVLQDAPYLPLCEPAPQGEAARLQLQERIARNPGDGLAWAGLAALEDGPRSGPVLRAATLAAPHHPNVLRLRAADALASGRMDEAVSLLVQLVRFRGDPAASQVLAQLAAAEQGRTLLQPHLAQARDWLPATLQALVALKIPPNTVLPLVAEAGARDQLPPASQASYMRALQNGGFWWDAYGLWVARHKEPVPLLYNGGFDQAFRDDGFDWDYAQAPRSRAGVLLAQPAVAKRGHVLEFEFTGRALPTPIVRQHLMIGPGSYRLAGDYAASQLKSQRGLVWALRCQAGRKSLAGMSSPLLDTGGLWKGFQAELSVPPDCGPVATLQLETAAHFETLSGFKGRAAFDRLSIEKVGPLD